MSDSSMIYLLMGVTGSGKSTIGSLLSKSLAVEFHDGDDFHPASNVELMSKGIPLSDTERLPWLKAIRAKIEECVRSNSAAVFACSALKEKYRTILTEGLPKVQIIYLNGSPEVVAERLEKRSDHFMNPDLLPSQFEALEVPKTALTISVKGTPESIVEQILLQC